MTLTGKKSAREPAGSHSGGEGPPAPPSPRFVATLQLLSLVMALLYSGPLFGWGTLELMLIEDGCYSELCPDHEARSRTSACGLQMAKFNELWLMVILVQACGFGPGVAADAFGVPPVLVGSGIATVISCIGLGVSNTRTSDLFAPSMILLAAGGLFTYLVLLRSSFLAPSRQEAFVSMMSICFDVSAFATAFFLYLYEHLGWSRFEILTGFGLVGVPLFIAATCMWIKVESFHKAAKEYERSQKERPSLEDETGEASPLLPKPTDPRLIPRNDYLQSLSFLEQVFTLEFLGLWIYAFGCGGHSNEYLGTVRDDLQYLGDGGSMVRLFGVMLALGVFCVPIVVWMVKLNRHRPSNGYIIGSALSILIGILSATRSLNVQYLTFALFIYFRAYSFCCFSALIQRSFGMATTGKMFGAIYMAFAPSGLLTSSVTAYFLRYASGSLAIVHLIYTAISVVGLIPGLIIRRREDAYFKLLESAKSTQHV